MTKRIFRSILLVALGVLVASLVYIMGMMYAYMSEVTADNLEEQTELAAAGVEAEGYAYLDELEVDDVRLTWIAADGTVLYDSETEDVSSMENHLGREEVQEALETGVGDSKRFSKTLMEKLLYHAVLLEDGTVLRLSVSQYTVLTLLLGMLQPIIVVIVIALLLSVFLARRLAKQIVSPLNHLNLDDPLSNEEYDELSPLLKRIDAQQKQLKLQTLQLKRKQRELDTMLDHMSEGMILLGEQDQIMAINQAAQSWIGMDTYCVGKPILMVNRNLELQQTIEEAKQGHTASRLIELDESIYDITASPILEHQVVRGIVVLIVDATEREKAEQMRKEFTANVSHELKTPLQSISGYAELLANGLVRPQDVENFGDKIYTEAKRMILLIEDIINLSHLDEGAEDMQWQTFDLDQLVKASVADLQKMTGTLNVSLTYEGETAEICAVPQLVQEIVHNLIDNAIKYNRENGEVCVRVSKIETGEAKLEVRDTGIGIAKEHLSRIFERFYRVDKSRSKAVGGTGLGLSIVKHAAGILHAEIDLKSTIGEGTQVTVTFQKA